MTLAIMQPYFVPYIGYFQLMQAADEFVIYDNIQFSKQGWINRNRILFNGKDVMITLPLKKDSDYLDIKDRYMANDWSASRKKLLNKITECYRQAPCFETVFPILKEIILFDEYNLFDFLLNSISVINKYLEIKTPLILSSSININHELKSQEKVIEICKDRKTDIYLNPIGGIDLYNKQDFAKEGIELRFIKTGDISYLQFKNEFVPFLSIIDVMMFNSKESILHHLNQSYLVL